MNLPKHVDLILMHRSSEGKLLSYAALDLDESVACQFMCDELFLFFREKAMFLDNTSRRLACSAAMLQGKSTKGSEDEFLAEKIFSSKALYTFYSLDPSWQHKIVSVMREHDLVKGYANFVDEEDGDCGMDASSLFVHDVKRKFELGWWKPPFLAIELDPALIEPGNRTLYVRYGKLAICDASRPPPPELSKGEESDGELDPLDAPDYEGLDNDVAILRATFKVVKSEASESENEEAEGEETDLDDDDEERPTKKAKK